MIDANGCEGRAVNAIATLQASARQQGRDLVPARLSRIERLWIAFGCWAMGVQAAVDEWIGRWER